MIQVNFGEQEYHFKFGSRGVSVLDTLGRMHPPKGCLKYVEDDAELVSLSQGELSQVKYTYYPGHGACDVVDSSLIRAVMRLQLKKGTMVESCGTAVLCSNTGICLTADHCLGDLPRRPNLLIGGHAATVCARDPSIDIAALKIRQDTGLPFIRLGNGLTERMMKIQLISFPAMVDTEFGNVEPTITHGQVVNYWSPNLVAADYAAFSNSSGGAVTYQNQLMGIHIENLWQKDDQLEQEIGVEGKLACLERNMGNKGALSTFVNLTAIHNFLDCHDLLPRRTSGTSSSSSGGKRRRFSWVSTPQ